MRRSRLKHGMTQPISFLVFVIFLQSTYSLPTPQGACPVLECTGDNSVFAFQPQTTYVYQLEASTENVLSSTGSQGKLHLTATAELQAVSSCQFGLSISQVQVVGTNAKKHASLSALEGKAVQVGLQNGRLVPELCVDSEDTINTINLKRAVASLLQVTSSSKQQTDIFGNCAVDVTVSKGGEGITMYNTYRDLNRCQRRENIISDIPVSSYLLNSDTQAAPFLAASVKTQQRVRAGILEATTSHEEYDYRPFSNQGSGALVSVHTSLTLLSQRAQVNFRAPANAKLESVIFEPPHSSGSWNVKVETIRTLVNDISQAMTSGVNANVPNLMHRLVRSIRQTSRDDLLNAFSQVKHTSKVHKKVYLDHLMLAGTGESIEVLAELIKRKEYEGNPALFYTKLAFVRHATLASVRAVKNLLESPNPSRELVLGAGSLAGNYLTQHAHQQEKDIDDIVLEIAKGLGNTCNVKAHEQENKILTALKGIHNAHYIPDAVADKLKECATNKKASLRVRSAALDSIQGDAANKKLQQVAYDILGDTNEDSELRIKAYLVLVTCPCGNVATFVKNLLEKEPVNQVGSFIVTHIRNLRASNNPEKEAAKKHLANIPLPANKFPFDVRKFSSNSELSYLFGQVNAAASGEANVIFSQKSFLPRFTSLNLTTQLFGHSFNLLEVGLRAENLEQILESYFGPRGYFKSHEADDVFKSGVEKTTELANKIKERANRVFRSRRSVAKADVDKMAAKVQIQKDVDNINLDLYLKLFGAELAFFTYYGDPSTMSPSALVDKIFDGVDNIIKDAKNYNYELKQNLLLFDSELVYPTATGFPLRLIASSTAAVRLNLAGNFDIKKIIKDPKNAKMGFNVQPSVAIEVVGNMELDFYAASSGFKHAVTMHTSTGVDMTLEVLNGKGFDLNVGTPLTKQEIITAKSELFATSRDGAQETDTPLQFQVQRRDYHGCFDQLASILGVTFCCDVGFPYDTAPKKGPFFPLNGPAKLFLSVEKEDKGLSTYKFRALYTDDDPDRRKFELTFSTPNSAVERTVSLLVDATRNPNHELKINFISPIISAGVMGKVINTAKEHTIEVDFNYADVKYHAKLGLQGSASKKSDSKTVYRPILEYSGPSGNQQQEVTLDGTITVEQNKEAQKFKYVFKALKLKAGNSYVLDGFVSRDQNAYATDLTLKYSDGAQSISTKANLNYGPNIFHTYLEGHMSEFPDFAFAINYDLKFDKGMLDNKLKVHHGMDLKNEINCITVNQYYKFVGGGESKEFELTTKNLVSYPALEFKVHADAEATHRSIHYILETGFEQHRLSSEMTLKHSIPGPDGELVNKDPGGYELQFKCGANDKTIIINSGRQIVTADTSKLHLEVKLLPADSFFKVDSDVTHRLQKNDLKLKITSVFTMSGQPNTYTLCTGLQSNLQNCEGHIKFTKDEEDMFYIKGEGTRGETKSGKFSILLKGYLEGSGTYSHSEASHDGNLKAELFSPKLDRRVKINGDLKQGAKATSRVATLEILLDADKDANKRIFLDTTVDIGKDGRTYDTKSSLTLNDQIFNLALKGVTASRVPTDAGVLMRFDSQLELPSKQKISVFSDLLQAQPNGVVTHLKIDDGQGTKINYEGKYAKVAGYTTPTYDASGKLNLLANKKNVNALFSVAHKDVADKRSIEYKFDVTGSAIPEPLTSSLLVELLDQPRYQLKATYGDKYSADLTALISLQDDVEKFGEVHLTAKTAIEGYESIKYDSSIKTHLEEHKFFEGKVDEKLEINGVRKYDAKALMKVTSAEGHVSGINELILFLGPDEQEPRIYTNTFDYKGPGLLMATFNTPQSIVMNATLKQGTDMFGLAVNALQPGDGTTSRKLFLEAYTPIQDYDVISIAIDHKSSKSGQLLETDIDYHLGEKNHFTINGNVDLSEQRRSFGVNLQRVKPASANPIIKILLAYSKPTSSEISGELNFAAGEAKPHSLAVVGTAKFPGGIDDFEVGATVNSESFKLKNVRVELSNKPGAKGGRRINISAKSPEKTYLQGSTSYQKRDDGRSLTYEGQGNIKFGEESRSSTFKLVLKKLTKEADLETGYDAKLNADITGSKGKMTFEVQNSLTDKTIRLFNNFCNEENKCSVLEISNILKSYDASELHVENKVAFDVHHIAGVPPFLFTGKFHGKKLEFEHRLAAELGAGADATKYIYEAFCKQNKAGLHLTLPKRTMVLDATYTRPDDSGKAKADGRRNYKLEVVGQLDKLRQPDQKLTLISSMDIKKDKNDGMVYNSALKISHPTLSKDFAITSKTTVRAENQVDSTHTFDVFATKNDAIVISLKNNRVPVNGGHNLTSVLSITSQGQNLDVKILSHAVATKTEIGFGSIATIKDSKLGNSESSILFFLNADNALLLITVPTCELLRLHAECKKTPKEDTKSNFEITALQTLALTGEFVGYRQFKLQGFNKNKPTEKLVYSGSLEMEKEFVLEGEQVTGNKVAKLFRFHVALDTDHFLQVDQSVNAEQLKKSLEWLTKAGKAAGDRLTALVADISRDATTRGRAAIESFKRVQTNFKPLVNYLKAEYDALLEEIQADTQAQEIIDLVKKLVTGVAQLTSKTLETVTVQLDKITSKMNEVSAKFAELASKLSPVITEAVGKVSKALATVFANVVNIFSQISASVIQLIKDNSDDLQRIFAVIVEFFKEQSQHLTKLLVEARVYIDEFVTTVLEQLKTMPVVDNLRERFKEIQDIFVSRFEGVFREIAETLKETVPTTELKDLIDNIIVYIEKKINKEPVDEIAELEKLLQQFVKAVRALLQAVDGFAPQGIQGFSWENIFQIFTTQFSVENLRDLPKFTNVRFNLIQLLTSENLPSAGDLLATYSVPRHLDDIFPPHKAFAQISASQHFITFDGDHYKLKGDCQYLLARDFGDGNFSLTVELAGGKLRSIDLFQASSTSEQDHVKLKADYSVVLNGQSVELPFQHPGLSMFRTLNQVHVKSWYGVLISCDLHHELCSFGVNGYYFGKTRGLLGTISNEKYDDLALPNGKIASTVQQFANAYKLSESCVNQPAVQHKHVNHKECTEAFTERSSMSACFRFVDVTPFRQACDDALDDGNNREAVSKAICSAAAAYVAKCRYATFLHPSLPSNCAKCDLGNSEAAVGSTTPVKAPQGKADIVILVQQVSDNEQAFNELLTPLTNALKNDLTERGITDTHFALIGYGGPGQKWPALFTSNGKFAFDGKRPAQLKFGADVETSAVETNPLLDFLGRVRRFTSLEFGQNKLGQAFEQVLQYPFRADAAKSVVLLRHSPCEKSPLPISFQQLQLLYIKDYFQDRGIKSVFLQPVEITTNGDKKLIGFDADNALTFAKKQVDPVLRSDIIYSADSCASFIDLVQPTVISTKNFRELKAEPRKKFIQAASARLAHILTETETTQTCDCQLQDGLHTETRCIVTTAKDSSRPANPTRKGGKA